MITDYDIGQVADKVKESIWRAFDEKTSPDTKCTVTAKEVSDIANAARSEVSMRLHEMRVRYATAK